VKENTQMTRWLLKPAKLVEYQALKDQKYKACCERINAHERKTLMKKEICQIEFGELDEKMILVHYMDQLISQSKKFFVKKVHNQVVINAVTLFRRYYLKNSLLECDAHKMFVSTIILGAKLAEVNMTQKTFDEILTELKLKPDAYVKTEMKILMASQFDLSILDHSMVYHSFFSKLATITKQPRNEDAMATLIAEDAVYYKSDLFFTLDSIMYATAAFNAWLKVHHPEVKLRDICGDIPPQAVEEIEHAGELIQKAAKVVGEFSKTESQNAARRFQVFYQRLMTSQETRAGPALERIKRPENLLKKRNPEINGATTA